jgi:hypothetical protein
MVLAPPATTVTDDVLESLKRDNEASQLRLSTLIAAAQSAEISNALSLVSDRHSDTPHYVVGEAGVDVQEGIYSPEDYIDPLAYRREDYGYTSFAATFTTRTDRLDGRNFPYWVSEPELAAIRGTARLLTSYNKHGVGILDALGNYTIATGLQIRAIDRAAVKGTAPADLLAACNVVLDELDQDNQIKNDLDQEMFARRCREGEKALAMYGLPDGHTFLRVVEPDQISEPTNKGELEDWLRYGRYHDETGLPFQSNWSFGIHITAGNVQATHGYYVQWDYRENNWDYFPGGNDPCYPPAGDGEMRWLEFSKTGSTDRNIKRGVSDFWPIGNDLELSRKLLRNLAVGAGVQAAIAWIQKYPAGTTQGQVQAQSAASADWLSNRTTYQGNSKQIGVNQYQGATILKASPGMDYQPGPSTESTAASGMISIFEAMLRSCGTRWGGIPEHILTGSAANNNFASILEAGTPFVKSVEKRQQWEASFWKRVCWKALEFAHHYGRLGSCSWAQVKAQIDILVTPARVDVSKRKEEAEIDHQLWLDGQLSDATYADRHQLDREQEVAQGAKVQQQAASGTGGTGEVATAALPTMSLKGNAHEDQPATLAGSVTDSGKDAIESMPWWAGYAKVALGTGGTHA